MDNADWLDYIEPEAKEDNSLQAVYQMMFDPECEEEYIDGAEIPGLYSYNKFNLNSPDNFYEPDNVYEYLEILKENSKHPKNKLRAEIEKCEGIIGKIKDHNRRDVERLKKIAEKVIPMIPDWEIERNINKL